MNKKLCSKWMIIASLVLGLAGLVFILVSVFDADASNGMLITGMLCITAGNLFNVIRMQQNRKDQEE